MSARINWPRLADKAVRAPVPGFKAQTGVGRIIILFLLSVLPLSAANQFPPGRLTFQGHLTDAAGAPLGMTATTNVTVQFRLYNHATGTDAANIVWAEQQSVKVSRGFFSALLGGGAPTGVSGEFHTNNLAGVFIGPDASDRFLGVTVVGQGDEIRPRIQFFASPFAYLSRSTAALVDSTGQEIVKTAPGMVGVNLGGAAPTATLDVGGNVKATTFVGDGGNLTGVPVMAANLTGQFDGSRIADGSITGAKFATGTVATAQLAPNAVTAAKLSADAAQAVAALAGSVGDSGVILSSNKLDTTLINMGYVNIGSADLDGDKWTIRATKDTPNAPTPRLNRIGSTDHRHSATLWTGSKWILWSGFVISGSGWLPSTDGAAFDPALNTWTPISTVGAPVGRDEINFLWTGTKGLVWGGHNGAHLANGGIYDPAANTWSPMSTVNQPSVRTRQRNVWTGTEMFVWGGETSGAVPVADGKLYNPATDTWRNVSASPLIARRDFNAFWTGSEVLVWGGERGSNIEVNDGAFYNPATDTWRMMSSVNAPTAREWGAGVLTDKEFIIWGGVGTTLANSDGGRYDLATDTWIPFKTPNLYFSYEGAAFWNGSKVYYVQGRSSAYYVNETGGGYHSGYSFDPATGKWDYLPAAPITQSFMPHTWTGTELLTFATFRDSTDRTVLSFKPKTEAYFYQKKPVSADRWVIRATKDTPNAPLPRFVAAAGSPAKTVWTGSKWLVWGDGMLTPSLDLELNSGAMFDPATDSWQPMSSTNAPSPRSHLTVVWTGDQAIYWGGYTNNFIGDGKRYFPANNTWSNMTATGAPSARARHSAVWTGTEMIVWGGAQAAGTLRTTNNGARYNPATDAWTAMATPPTGITNRCDHLAVWTGSEMIIWGGSTSDGIAGVFDNGARYNPANNTWSMMSSNNAPLARAYPLAVWTGTELIVWGGYLGNSTNSNLGNRYNPATDTWTTFNTGQYTWSQDAAVVWTGSKVIWAGGVGQGGDMVNRSGRGGITYDPATGIVGTLPVAPIQQRSMPYTWTGTQILTFGSWEDFTDRTVLSYTPQP